MASRSLSYLLFLLYKDIIVSAATIFLVYTDASCKTLYATVETDTSAGNGQCGEFGTSLDSASSAFVDDGCSGIYHALCGLLTTKTVLTMNLISHDLHRVGRRLLVQQQRYICPYGNLYEHEHWFLQRGLSSNQRHRSRLHNDSGIEHELANLSPIHDLNHYILCLCTTKSNLYILRGCSTSLGLATAFNYIRYTSFQSIILHDFFFARDTAIAATRNPPLPFLDFSTVAIILVYAFTLILALTLVNSKRRKRQ